MNAISENINGRDLRSYLITPVQRMPRYVLFLRDLIKSTPLSHPDAEFLRVAFSDIDEITKKIDKAASIAKKQQELMKLQKGINNFVFLDKQRSLLFQCPLTVNGQKKGDVYLFEDLIIFIQGNSKVIFDSGIQIFPYRPFWPDELSITLDTSDKKYVSEKSYFVTFLNPEDKKAFFDEVAKMQQKLQFRCGPNHLLLEWETPDIQKTMPLITQPSVTLYDDSLMITSAAKKEVFLYRLVLSNGYLFQTVDVKFPVFKLPNVVLSRHNIMYIINNGNLLKFDPRTNKVTQLSVTFTPRYGHSACFWHDSILIFGGKSIQTHQLLNDLIIYNTTKNTMITVGPNETSPPPRWQHCSFVDYDKLYVFSGETVDGITNDMYCYDLDKSEWSPCETIEGLLPRKGGKSIITNHFTVFLGGTEGNKPQIYSLKKRVLLEIENYGNLPNALENFDAIFGEDGSIIIITETNLYRVTTPAVLKKSSSMNKLKASEIDGNDSFMTRRNKIRNRAKKERLKAAGGSLRKKKPQRAISQALFNIEPDNEENPLNDDEILLYGDDEFFDEYGTPRKSPIAKIPGSSQRGSPRSPVRSPTRSGRSPLPIPNSHTRFRSLNLSDEEDEDELSSSSTPSRKRYEHTQLSISPTSQSTERAEETQESSQSVSPLNLGSINDNQGKIDDSIIEEILVEEVVEEEIVQHHVAELEPELQLSPRGYNKIKAKLNLNENLIVEVEPTGNISFLQILATATISAAVTTGAFLLYLRRHRT
ncbi:hypothetical protein TRFO_38326 [Tritrichomonas foetus]|uniref:DH domain-containing protein n=1 Tax=Tritrichomonas foetus TaxID=1144522 RepID=A0A1J4JDT0_9EUKA|nr:hypothetical protein TRFO_38326 [Tritrichomonas foetus]|eukprot:OHS95597.1 hypothetical protein TRFO_38326 [Tritrichomonas foetus]